MGERYSNEPSPTCGGQLSLCPSDRPARIVVAARSARTKRVHRILNKFPANRDMVPLHSKCLEWRIASRRPGEPGGCGRLKCLIFSCLAREVGAAWFAMRVGAPTIVGARRHKDCFT